MSSLESDYSSYNVLESSDEWDSHTREIVLKRMGPFEDFTFFTQTEAEYIALIAQHIVYDNRAHIIDWIVHHFDSKLSEEVGEDQRKQGVAEEKYLIRKGLESLDHIATHQFGKNFEILEKDKQFTIISDLQKGKTHEINQWAKTPAKDFFNKLASVIVSAYYSHPEVWSEIGYGGPAYPRGYVRVEFGLTDPWEAKRNGK